MCKHMRGVTSWKTNHEQWGCETTQCDPGEELVLNNNTCRKCGHGEIIQPFVSSQIVDIDDCQSLCSDVSNISSIIDKKCYCYKGNITNKTKFKSQSWHIYISESNSIPSKPELIRIQKQYKGVCGEGVPVQIDSKEECEAYCNSKSSDIYSYAESLKTCVCFQNQECNYKRALLLENKKLCVGSECLDTGLKVTYENESCHPYLLEETYIVDDFSTVMMCATQRTRLT